MPSSYFLQSSSITYAMINKLLLENYSHKLLQEQVDDSKSVLASDKLVQLWNCLTAKDSLLERHQEAILKSWALAPATNGCLYSTRSSIIPVIHQDLAYIEMKAFKILYRIGLPVIDFNCLPDTIPTCFAKYFPMMQNYDRILDIVYHLHYKLASLDNLLPSSSDAEYILSYLARSSFLHDEDLKNKIKSLPLFKNIEGNLTSLSNKNVYRWPYNGFCTAGYSIWAPSGSVVFLEYSGDWRKLSTDFNDIGSELDEKEIFTELVQPCFTRLSSKDRQNHLEYIKEYIYPTVKRDSEYTGRSQRLIEQCHSAEMFLNKLKNLRCIEHSKTKQLMTIGSFSDHTVPIFNCFSSDFLTLPHEYHDEKWLIFLRDLGLQVKVKETKFIEFCSRIEKGDHKNITEASSILLDYLFDHGIEWEDYYMSEISKICFVKIADVPNLSWIKVPCHPPKIIVSSGTNYCLTKLKQSALYDLAPLIWTVKPVFKAPELKRIEDHFVRHSLFNKLGVVVSPSPEDVVDNIINISNSGLADVSLFSKYRSEYICPNNEHSIPAKLNVIDIITKSLDLLKENECTNELLSKLKACACIPVSAKPVDHDPKPSHVVLVKPVMAVKVLHLSDNILKPYINELPSCLFSYYPLLQRIGVREAVELSHVWQMLEALHGKFGRGGTDDPNNINLLNRAVTKLHELSSNRDFIRKADSPHIPTFPLFLPCLSGKSWSLKQSKSLVYVDSTRYQSRNPINFNLINTRYSLFQIPPYMAIDKKLEKDRLPQKLFHKLSHFSFSDKDDSRATVVSEKKFCQSLPKEVRPLELSLCAKETKLDIGTKSNDNNIVLASLTLSKQYVKTFKEILPGMLEYHMEKNDGDFIKYFEHIIVNLNVEVIKGLKVNVLLEGEHIGTLTTPGFLLEKGVNDEYMLYIDDSETGGNPQFWIELSRSLLMEVAKLVNTSMPTYWYFKMIEPIKSFFEVHSLDALRNLGNIYDIQLAIIDDDRKHEEDDADLLIPKLGKKVPEEFIDRLDNSINNIFKPQEWVAYEIEEQFFVWAIILYPLLDHQDETEVDKYHIVISEDDSNNNGKQVSVLDLYKITSPSDLEVSDITDLEIFDENSVTALTNEIRDTQAMKKMKKSICEDLRMIWRLKNETDKKKAIKRLYIKYHPDKASPLNKEIYDEAFKFLLRQIHRLENGLPLEDPYDEINQDWIEVSRTANRPSEKWSAQFRQWEGYVPRYSARSTHNSQTRSKHTHEAYEVFFSQYQSKPDIDEAERWLKQAFTDCNAMKILQSEMRKQFNAIGSKLSVVCQVIFLAHEVVEKSLKSGMYKLAGLNSAYLSTHEIVCHARTICSQKPLGRSLWSSMQQLQVSLEDIAIWIDPYYLKSRFPNKHADSQAPVDVYDESVAELAADYAEIVIKFVDNL